MGRPKGFSREEVLLKSIATFWEKGFADTTLQDLEQATGVNKSGLYTEFRNKEDIFIESLRHYLETRGGMAILSTHPLGWDNIRRFLEIGQTYYGGRKGCFSVNSMREVTSIPNEGQQLITKHNALLKRRIASNIKAASPASDAATAADAVLTFFFGLCIEQNLHPDNAPINRKIAGFMDFLRSGK